MVIDDFLHYLYWQNRGWGTPEETMTKIKHLYSMGLYTRSLPIDGALDGLRRLRDLGFRLILVTARSESQRESTEKWLEQYYKGVFEECYFTGAFTHLDSTPQEKGQDNEGKEVVMPVVKPQKRSKAEVSRCGSRLLSFCYFADSHGVKSPSPSPSPSSPLPPPPCHSSQIAHQIGARLLIDDSIENALDCATASPPVPVLLFGAYPWNRFASSQDTPEDMLAHDERIRRGIDTERAERLGEQLRWTGEDIGQALPLEIKRVRDWNEVVEFVKSQIE